MGDPQIPELSCPGGVSAGDDMRWPVFQRFVRATDRIAKHLFA